MTSNAGRTTGALAALLTMVCLSSGRVLAPKPPEGQLKQAAAARAILSRFDSQKKTPYNGKLHVVYFTPRDLAPIGGWRKRVNRNMEAGRAFFATQMDSYGLGKRTFALDRGPDKKLVIHYVKGKQPREYYGGKVGSDQAQSRARVAEEVRPALAAKGIKLHESYCIIFMNHFLVKGNRISGDTGGNTTWGHGTGTAFVGDVPQSDPLNFTAKDAPVVWNGAKRMLREFAGGGVGGVIHEIGHVFGCPHGHENAADRGRGQSLMGFGNLSFAAERRGAGPGTFLSLTDALRLASHPMFSATQHRFRDTAKSRIVAVEAKSAKKEFTVKGRIASDIPCYAVLAYHYPDATVDYLAHTSTAIPDEKGNITLRCPDLAANKHCELVLEALFVNGGRLIHDFHYEVNKAGNPDVRGIRMPRLTSLRCFNFPEHFVLHRDWLGWMAKVGNDHDRQLASLQLVPGLADPQLVSLQPWGHPRHFFRHQGGRVKLHHVKDSQLFRRDATFRMVPGLADKTWVSFKSFNFPGSYLRHKRGELWIDKNDGTELFMQDATFRRAAPLDPTAKEAYEAQIQQDKKAEGAKALKRLK